MKPFHDLATAIQVGTRRTAPTRTEYLEGVEGTPEKIALLEAGALGLMTRAGMKGATNIGPLPESSIESGRIAHAAATLLQEALADRPARILKEWVTEATRRGLIAPPSVLPRLIELADKDRSIVNVLGARGRWLGDQMGVEFLETTNPFEDQRRDDPHNYRIDMLEKLDGFDWQQRVQALSALKIDLSREDIPVLELGVADRRKEVREVARDMLVRLPQSDLALTIAKQASSAVTIEKSLLRKSLKVNPPDPADLPKVVTRTTSANLGARAAALMSLVSFTPPKLYGAEPKLLLDLSQKTDYAEALQEGWLHAAALFGDEDWIDELFRNLPNPAAMPGWMELARLVPDTVFDEVIEQRAKLSGHHYLVPSAIRIRGKVMSPRLSRSVFSALLSMPRDAMTWREIALLFHPSILPVLHEPWTEDETFENIRQEVIGIVDLRSRLLASLDKP